jgi:hypothetical protein
VLKRVAGGALAGLLALRGGRAGAQPGCRREGHPCEGNQECCPGLECRVTGPGNAERCAKPRKKSPPPPPKKSPPPPPKKSPPPPPKKSPPPPPKACFHSFRGGCKAACTSVGSGLGGPCEDICGPACPVGTENRRCKDDAYCDPKCFKSTGHGQVRFIC